MKNSLTFLLMTLLLSLSAHAQHEPLMHTETEEKEQPQSLEHSQHEPFMHTEIEKEQPQTLLEEHNTSKKNIQHITQLTAILYALFQKSIDMNMKIEQKVKLEEMLPFIIQMILLKFNPEEPCQNFTIVDATLQLLTNNHVNIQSMLAQLESMSAGYDPDIFNVNPSFKLQESYIPDKDRIDQHAIETSFSYNENKNNPELNIEKILIEYNPENKHIQMIEQTVQDIWEKINKNNNLSITIEQEEKIKESFHEYTSDFVELLNALKISTKKGLINYIKSYFTRDKLAIKPAIQAAIQAAIKTANANAIGAFYVINLRLFAFFYGENPCNIDNETKKEIIKNIAIRHKELIIDFNNSKKSNDLLLNGSILKKLKLFINSEKIIITTFEEDIHKKNPDAKLKMFFE